jgi:CubicO group peptidase (beta-lactamase class C family)
VPARLDRIALWYQAQIDRGAGGPTGAVVAIAHDDKLAYLHAIGTQDRAKRVPMKTDSIFWIASMTKPVTSVAAMMLVEEGKLDLNVPIATYLPELKDRTVGERPSRRQPQVVDLLRHTAGLTYPRKAIRPGIGVSITSYSGAA